MTILTKKARDLKKGDRILYGGTGIVSTATITGNDTAYGQADLTINNGPYGVRVAVVHADLPVPVLQD